jgi:hypothetical protein
MSNPASPSPVFRGRDPPGDSGSPLGLILGLVFGILAIVLSGLAVVYWRSHQEEKHEEEPEVDPVTQFYSDNRQETEAQYEMAFENPVFDRRTNGEVVSEDGFEEGFDEAAVI